MGGFPPPQLNILIICRAVVGSHMDIRSVQILLENMPSANDHRDACRPVYPEMHGATCSSCEWGESLVKAPRRIPASCNSFINIQFPKISADPHVDSHETFNSCHHVSMLCPHSTQVCNSFQFCRLIQCVVMPYIPGTDKSSEILTTNIEKRRGENNKQKKKKYKVQSPRKWREQRILGVSISCHPMIK